MTFSIQQAQYHWNIIKNHRIFTYHERRMYNANNGAIEPWSLFLTLVHSIRMKHCILSMNTIASLIQSCIISSWQSSIDQSITMFSDSHNFLATRLISYAMWTSRSIVQLSVYIVPFHIIQTILVFSVSVFWHRFFVSLIHQRKCVGSGERSACADWNANVVKCDSAPNKQLREVSCEGTV